MRFLSRRSIKFQIFLIALAGIVGFVIYWGYNFTTTKANFDRLQAVTNVYFPVLEKLDANIVRLDKLKQTFQSAVISGELDFLEPVEELASSTMNAYREMEALDPAHQDQINSLERRFEIYVERSRLLSKDMINGALSPAEFKPAVEEMKLATEAYNNLLVAFRDASYNRFTATIEYAEHATNKALGLGLSIGLIMVLVLVATTWFIANGITSNIKNVSKSLQALTAGEADLTRTLTSVGDDEVSALVQEFNRFLARLRHMIAQIVSTGDSLFTAARELTDVTNITYEGSRRQQQQAEAVMVSINQLASAVQEVARNADLTSTVTKETASQAQEGRSVVANTIAVIDELANEVTEAAEVIRGVDQRSQDVSTVLDVIRAVADQTNLLALNAAIEAARAGDHGRGFSIVAEEVRSLSRRTEEATLQIKDIIDQLQVSAHSAVAAMDAGREKARRSVLQAAGAGNALESITKAIAGIADQSVHIANATDDQTKVTAHINNSMSAITSTIHDVTRGAERTSENSEKLAQVARTLRSLVGQFRL